MTGGGGHSWRTTQTGHCGRGEVGQPAARAQHGRLEAHLTAAEAAELMRAEEEEAQRRWQMLQVVFRWQMLLVCRWQMLQISCGQRLAVVPV